jgi:glycosyltransferase involved in cell wall biosynthesis
MDIVIHAWRDLDHPYAGGSEKLVNQIAFGMTERGHQVHLICGGPVGQRPYGVTNAGGTFSQYLRMPWIDRRLTRHADLVVDVANGATYCTPLWRRKPTLLMVHHIHTDQWPQRFPWPLSDLGSFFERRILPFIYRRCLVLTISRSTAEGLRGIGMDDSQIRIIKNAVEVTDSSSIRSPTPLFVVLGRLVAHKRIGLLLNMWEHVRPVVGGRLVILGDGPELSALQARVVEGAEFLGRVDDTTKNQFLSEAWMLVHGASHEGWGIAISEAASYGTPSIGFNVPGVRDAITHSQTGLLANDVDDFIKYWIELASDNDRRTEYGANARNHALQLDIRHTIDRFEEVALEAISRRQRRSKDRVKH